MKYRKVALWPGVYEGGLGGEIVFWYPGLPCYRCLVPGRYKAQQQARAEGRSLDPPSDGTTIFEDGFIDVVTGQLVLGLLTRGAENRYGRLIEKLGDRNFLHVKLDPEYRWNGRDVIREQLGIPEDNDRFFAWNIAARRDPDGGQPPCPDCVEFGHSARIDRIPATPPAKPKRPPAPTPPAHASAFADPFPSPPLPAPWDVKNIAGQPSLPSREELQNRARHGGIYTNKEDQMRARGRRYDDSERLIVIQRGKLRIFWRRFHRGDCRGDQPDGAGRTLRVPVAGGTAVGRFVSPRTIARRTHRSPRSMSVKLPRRRWNRLRGSKKPGFEL